VARRRGSARELPALVREKIASRIESGAWRPGQRLPPEPQLATTLGVSRATLREALRSLQEDGFLTRTRGAGTFVTHRPRLKNNLDANFGVTDLIRSMGLRPGTENLRTYEVRASPVESEHLALPPGARLAVVERVRTADDRPVVLSHDLIPLFLVQDRPDFLLGLRQGSIYERFEEELGIVVVQGIAAIRPSKADRRQAAQLRVPRGTLLLHLEQVDYDALGRPVLLSHEYHVAEAFEVTVVRRGPGRRAPMQAGAPSRGSGGSRARAPRGQGVGIGRG
jgi:GntR family transcriptional regulator